MAGLKTKSRKTVEDYLRLPEGIRAELIEGELFMSPSPKDRHQRIVGRLFRILAEFVETCSLGEVRIAPLDVHLPTGDVVQPDIIFVQGNHSSILQDWIRGVPDLLVEVLSPENPERDRIIKRDLYAANGVREYWIVDDTTRSVEVRSNSGGSYPDPAYFEEADELVSPLLPGLSLAVRRIFE